MVQLLFGCEIPRSICVACSTTGLCVSIVLGVALHIPFVGFWLVSFWHLKYGFVALPHHDVVVEFNGYSQ